MSRAVAERIAGWVSDVCLGDGLSDFPAELQGQAAGVLDAWLAAACERGHCEPDELELPALRAALLEHVARLDLSPAVHRHVPALCRHALSELERGGRIENGEELGTFVFASAGAYATAAAGRIETLRRPGAKLGRNDPCPCGSGKKFKSCCLGKGG